MLTSLDGATVWKRKSEPGKNPVLFYEQKTVYLRGLPIPSPIRSMQVVTHKKHTDSVVKHSNADPRAAAVLRLQADLNEVLRNPLPNVSATPLEDDILTWHVNMRGGEAPFDKAVFHLILRFPINVWNSTTQVIVFPSPKSMF
jgi:ubiquitin-protein ligase